MGNGISSIYFNKRVNDTSSTSPNVQGNEVWIFFPNEDPNGPGVWIRFYPHEFTVISNTSQNATLQFTDVASDKPFPMGTIGPVNGSMYAPAGLSGAPGAITLTIPQQNIRTTVQQPTSSSTSNEVYFSINSSQPESSSSNPVIYAQLNSGMGETQSTVDTNSKNQSNTPGSMNVVHHVYLHVPTGSNGNTNVSVVSNN